MECCCHSLPETRSHMDREHAVPHVPGQTSLPTAGHWAGRPRTFSSRQAAERPPTSRPSWPRTEPPPCLPTELWKIINVCYLSLEGLGCLSGTKNWQILRDQLGSPSHPESLSMGILYSQWTARFCVCSWSWGFWRLPLKSHRELGEGKFPRKTKVLLADRCQGRHNRYPLERSNPCWCPRELALMVSVPALTCSVVVRTALPLTFHSKSRYSVMARALGRASNGIEFNYWFYWLLAGWPCTCLVIPLNFSFLVCKVGDGINTHLLYKSWLWALVITRMGSTVLDTAAAREREQSSL